MSDLRGVSGGMCERLVSGTAKMMDMLSFERLPPKRERQFSFLRSCAARAWNAAAGCRRDWSIVGTNRRWALLISRWDRCQTSQGCLELSNEYEATS